MTVADSEMNAVAFRLFTSKEVQKLSVVEVTTSVCFDSLGHPIKGGLYDLAMGPNGSYVNNCSTCKQTVRNCCGHFGHIQLPVPVYNPLFKKDIHSILRSACSSCSKIAAHSRYKTLVVYQLKLLTAGYVTESQELEAIVAEVVNTVDKENVDIATREKILEFIKEREINLAPKSYWTKTMESLRRQFIDNYCKSLENIKTCPYCQTGLRRVVCHQQKFMLPASWIKSAVGKDGDGSKVVAKSMKVNPVVILAEKAKQILRKIWSVEKELIMELLPILKDTDEEFPTDLFFMTTILVTPPKTRPLSILGGRVYEGYQTVLYKDIVKNSITMRNVMAIAKENNPDSLTEEAKTFINNIKGEDMMKKVQNCWHDLQITVNSLLSSDAKVAASGVMGLKQIIEKKEGAFRKYMMGKRVNYAARSVITPDPNLLIQEIGVPEQFAKKLTYPVKVNYFNVQELRRMVKNGPDVYPGATVVEAENGSIIRLAPGEKNKTKREGISKLLFKSIESGGGKIVHRHLLNGDVLLLNRQPTLHRPSIMAHQVRVLKGEKTLRMHYSNCKSYNADFDGDEMNAHLPQSEIARSEAYNIVNVRNNYLVPKDGTPLGGLIQDHIVSGVRMTLRGQFFDRKDYYQLVYQGLGHHRGDIKLLPPSILKPEVLWSGKQVISTILINVIPKNKVMISLNSTAKIDHRSWQSGHKRPWKCGKEFTEDYEMSESDVIIRNGQLLSGVLDKNHYGSTPYGLTHCLYELYGGNCSSKFLDSVGKLFTFYLQLNGFTLGIKDIIIKSKQDMERNKVIEEVRTSGDKAASKALGLDEVPEDLELRLEKAYFTSGTKFKEKLDSEYKKILDTFTNRINKVCLPRGLVTRFPENNLQLMVTSGAKGSTVNTMQISCLLGQIELEGKRPPWMISGRSLPCFKPFETAPRAGGYIDARFMTGITPQDFFYHCMAGREGLIDTAVKTSRSGYLQRCLIKHLEGVTVCYDGTVRDHDGSVIQFAYGEDGLEVSKSTFLNLAQMDFLYQNRNSIVDKSVLHMLKDSTDIKGIEKYKKQVRKWNKEWANNAFNRKCPNGFSVFSSYIRNEIKEKYKTRLDKATGRYKISSKIEKKWRKLEVESRKSYMTQIPDPVANRFNRYRDFGAITEKMEKLIEDYLQSKSTRQSTVDTAIRNVINIKYMSCQCQPGEAVGLLAAQSIGEPSTQMTLNTFHFAGRGEMNVTLGIPRLREILMTASKNIKTPYAEIPLGPDTPEIKNLGNELKKRFQMVTLSDVLEKIEVYQKLVSAPAFMFTYRIKFKFLPYKSYKNEFVIKPRNILLFIEKPFLLSLCKHLRKLGKMSGDKIEERKEEKILGKSKKEEDESADEKCAAGSPRRRSNSVSSNEDNVEGDDRDASDVKMRDRRKDECEYDDQEEDVDDPSGYLEETRASDEEPNETGEQLIKHEPANVDDGGEAEEQPQKAQVILEGFNASEIEEKEYFDFGGRVKRVLETFSIVKNYKFDEEKEEWCEMLLQLPATMGQIDFSAMLKNICDTSVLHSIPNVKRAIIYKNRNGNLSLKTEGINLGEMLLHCKDLDYNKLYTNDIHEMAAFYGIEAASRVIVNELKEVFSVYGITVNPRHLLLIADYMTHQGFFSAFNRVGMIDSPSPLQQMSFESTISFLKAAISRSKTDSLNSPTARIMMGRCCVSGTGSFDLIVDRTRKQPQVKDISFAHGFE